MNENKSKYKYKFWCKKSQATICILIRRFIMYCIKLIDEAGEREIIPNVGTEKYHTYNSVRR